MPAEDANKPVVALAEPIFSPFAAARAPQLPDHTFGMPRIRIRRSEDVKNRENHPYARLRTAHRPRPATNISIAEDGSGTISIVIALR